MVLGLSPFGILVLQEALNGYRKLQAWRSSVHVNLSFCLTLQNQRPPGWPFNGSLEVFDYRIVAGPRLELGTFGL